jgi:hypothetical protein
MDVNEFSERLSSDEIVVTMPKEDFEYLKSKGFSELSHEEWERKESNKSTERYRSGELFQKK